MALTPSHPDEPALHHQLRDALNQTLTSRDFFVWINVRPTGERVEFENLEAIVSDAEQWLSSLDPDRVDATELPERDYADKSAEVELRAIPKKPSARGRQTSQIVGNPEPVLAGWVT